VSLGHFGISVFGTLWHQCWTVTTFYEGAEVSNGHFGRSVQRTLRHQCQSVSDRSAARIASPPHVTSAPTIVILRLLLKTFLYIRNHTRHSNLTHNSFQSYFTFPRASCNKLLILSCPRPLGGGIKRWCCMTYVCLSRTCMWPKLSSTVYSFSDSLPHTVELHHGRDGDIVRNLFMSVAAICWSRHSQWAVTILAPIDPLRGNHNRRGAEVTRREYWGPKGCISSDVGNFGGEISPKGI